MEKKPIGPDFIPLNEVPEISKAVYSKNELGE